MRRTSLPRRPPPARLPLPLTRRLNIVRTLLVRGMLADLLAALAALVVASVAGEPQVREAIALEGAGHAHGTGVAASSTQEAPRRRANSLVRCWRTGLNRSAGTCSQPWGWPEDLPALPLEDDRDHAVSVDQQATSFAPDRGVG